MKLLLYFLSVIISGYVFSQNEQRKNDSIIAFINCPPEFPGGQLELSKFIKDNFNHQDIDSAKFNHGKLYITFWVEKDGSVAGIDIINPEKESIMHKNATPYKSMPTWKPACDENGPVRDKIWFPIIIDL
jgi:periplasmic protein TonB